MLIFSNGWNVEIQQYAYLYGSYSGYLESFDSHAIISAMWSSADHFQDYWAKKFFKDAQDLDKKVVVRIEQGTHQPEQKNGGGFVLHFTGRDADGVAFHFYIEQRASGDPYISKITYMNHGQLMRCPYI